MANLKVPCLVDVNPLQHRQFWRAMAFESSVKDTLYYDRECPICNAEIKRLEALADDQIKFVDIHCSDRPPIDKSALLSELHLIKSNSDLLIGLDANVATWRHTKWAKPRGYSSVANH